MTDKTEPPARVQHVYNFSNLHRIADRATSLQVAAKKLLSGASVQTGQSSVAAVLSGQTIMCALARQAAGTGANAHTHPREQFNYILQGTMMSDIEGDRVFASKGMILHMPANVVRTGLACPDEDLIFLAIEDTRSDMTGPPVDSEYEGPNCFPGFGSRSHEPRTSTAEVMLQSKSLPAGPGKRYVYDMSKNTDSARAPASAQVTSDAHLRLPPHITGKLLSGEHLHVAVLRLEPGATLVNYRRDNEQLAFVVEGELEVDLDDEQLEVRTRCILHIPPGTQHELTAPDGALIVLAQDKSGRDPPPG